jgi:predicted esterase
MADQSVGERFIEVPRTARYWVEGSADGARDVWFLLHGYGQLARDLLAAARPLAGAGRLLVAPEALSRFYPGASGGSHADSAVGASWMTREDREHEVADYVRYLDAAGAEVLGAIAPPPRVHLLGFSQGVATATRWAACGQVRPVTLVLWGAAPPVDLAREVRHRLAGLRIRLVYGTTDRLVSPDALSASAAHLREDGAEVTIDSFDGGHRLDDTLLAALARSQPA